jgi:hypothetical protein
VRIRITHINPEIRRANMADLVTPRVLPAIKGRLSFNTLDAEQAHKEALAGPYAKGAEAQGASKPYANVLLTETQFDMIVEFLTNSFFPFSVQQKKGEKHHLTQKEADVLLGEIVDGEKTPYNVPFSLPSEKTLALWPEAHRNVKLSGRYGVDLKAEAVVRKADELAVPDPDRTKFPDRLAINETTHTLYNGCWVLAQIEFYTYRIGANPGISANTDIIIFASDDTEFGGGAAVDDDALFAVLDA